MFKLIVCGLLMAIAASMHSMEKTEKNKSDVSAHKELISLIEDCAKIDSKITEADFINKLRQVLSHPLDINSKVQITEPNIVGIKEVNQWTLLRAAITHGFKKAIKILLNRGAQPAIGDDSGVTALHIAANFGENDLLKVLLQSGKNIGVRAYNGATLFHAAVTDNGLISTIKIIFDAYVENKGLRFARRALNFADDEKNTPLHYAIFNLVRIDIFKKSPEQRCESLKLIAQLLELGADPTLINHQGATPLHVAVWLGYDGIASTLLQYGAFVNARQKNGMTPLHVAMMVPKRSAIISLLLHAGANPSAVNEDQKTPLQIANMMDNQDAIATYNHWFSERNRQMRKVMPSSVRRQAIGLRLRLQNFLSRNPFVSLKK